jgi:hypothetical protein
MVEACSSYQKPCRGSTTHMTCNSYIRGHYHDEMGSHAHAASRDCNELHCQFGYPFSWETASLGCIFMAKLDAL